MTYKEASNKLKQYIKTFPERPKVLYVDSDIYHVVNTELILSGIPKPKGYELTFRGIKLEILKG